MSIDFFLPSQAVESSADARFGVEMKDRDLTQSGVCSGCAPAFGDAAFLVATGRASGHGSEIFGSSRQFLRQCAPLFTSRATPGCSEGQKASA